MRAFGRLAISTLVAVYLLILVGGIVRSTGSGMGCPDWPRCFGSWVPPTSLEQLPENYKEIYSGIRAKKNIRFAKYLRVFGMETTADAILNNPQVLQENDFNPVKTWIEYINRIIGVIIGLLIIAVFVASIKFRKSRPRITVIALLSLVLVIFQGWIGSFVVSTNLTPWTITVHMFLALLLVALLVYLVHITQPRSDTEGRSMGSGWLIAAMILLLMQILFGTQVREAIDQIALVAPRDQWIEGIAERFALHRSFSWAVLIAHLGLIASLRKSTGPKVFPLTLILLILGTILSGAGMAYFAVPAFLQPVHLLLATVTFGMQFLLLLKLNRKEETELSNA